MLESKENRRGFLGLLAHLPVIFAALYKAIFDAFPVPSKVDADGAYSAERDPALRYGYGVVLKGSDPAAPQFMMSPSLCYAPPIFWFWNEADYYCRRHLTDVERSAVEIRRIAYHIDVEIVEIDERCKHLRARWLAGEQISEAEVMALV